MCRVIPALSMLPSAISGRSQWTRAKSYDTFAPLGPWIETEVSPDDLKLETYLNGELRQPVRTLGPAKFFRILQVL